MQDPPEMRGRTPSVISEDAIRSQLAAISASAPFRNAQRSRRFLEFAVTQTLAGAQDSIKETVIALEVFERTGDFDPRIDAIVRVEATKLRTRLNDYYSGEGATAAVVIKIPKGSYVPRFSLRPSIEVGEVTTQPHLQPPAKRRPVRAAYAAAAVLIVAGAGLWFALASRFGAASHDREIPSIAVLPFLNLSGDPENAYFSDGLADQLTDAFTHVDGLRVASRTSAFSFKGKPLGVAEIGAKLRVNAVLEGSVQRADGRVRITLQLIRTSDGFHLWSQTFDREFQNIFEVQDEISRAVTRELKVSLADDASRRRSRRYTKDPEAFDLYLRGLHVLYRLGPGGSARAIALFQQAADRDPQFALAYSGIAIGESQSAYTEHLPPKEIAQRIRSAAEKALKIDDTLAEAHAILAMVEGKFDWNWTGAEQRSRRAIALDPQSSGAHLAYANLLMPMGRWEEALTECRTALNLDPFSVQMAYCTPWTHMFQGKAELALAEFRKLDAEQPGAFAVGIATAAMFAGREAEALSIMEMRKGNVAALIHEEPSHLGFLGYCYGRVGRTAEALEIERQLREAGRTQYVSPGATALVYLGLGRLDEARKAASRQIEEHSFSIYTLAGSLFNPLREDPQFAALLKTTGIPF